MSPVTDSVVVPAGFRIDYDDDAHRYWIPFPEEVVSVTTALGVLDKPALPWWGMTVGLRAAGTLLDQLGHDALTDGTGTVDDERVVELAKKHKLTVNHVKGKAADRGVGAHHALEQLAATGRLDLSKIEPEDQGYASGTLDFFLAATPTVVHAELMVGSLIHGFAGRLDLIADLPECELVVDAKKGTTKRFEAARWLLDLKSGKGVYPTSHFPQVEAYGLAADECGYGQTDRRAIIHVAEDGAYQVAVSTATSEDFLAIKAAYDAVARIKASVKKPRKAAA